MDLVTEIPIGYLVDGKFACTDCAEVPTDNEFGRDAYLFEDGKHHCPVYRINIGIYSQQCSICKKLVVDGVKKADGSGPLNLFG